MNDEAPHTPVTTPAEFSVVVPTFDEPAVREAVARDNEQFGSRVKSRDEMFAGDVSAAPNFFLKFQKPPTQPEPVLSYGFPSNPSFSVLPSSSPAELLALGTEVTCTLSGTLAQNGATHIKWFVNGSASSNATSGDEVFVFEANLGALSHFVDTDSDGTGDYGVISVSVAISAGGGLRGSYAINIYTLTPWS